MKLMKRDVCLWKCHETGIPDEAFERGLVMTLPSGEALGFGPMNKKVPGLKPLNQEGCGKAYAEWIKVPYGTEIEVQVETA